MELSDLRIFAAVVQEGGITRAAERLHRVQSNVTTRVRQLEAELGTALFIREGKRLYLSPAGRTLLEYSDRLLALSEEAVAAVQDTRARGLFRLGSMESTAAVRLPEVLTLYAERQPEVTLELRTGNPTQLSTALLNGELDAAFVAGPIAGEKFDAVTAFEEEVVIVTASDHPPIGKAAEGPKTVLVFEHGCPHRRRLEAWYAERGDLPERTIELGSYHAMLGCVVAGMGAALVPKSVLTTFPESRRLRSHVLAGAHGVLPTLLIWRKGADSPKIEALAAILDEIHQQVRD